MEKANRPIVPTRLTPQLLEHESLQQLPQQGAVGDQRPGVRPQQSARQPGVAEMQLRSFDQPLFPVPIPRGQPLQQIHPLQQRHILPYRRAAELERSRQPAHIEQLCRLRRRQRQQPRQSVKPADPGYIPNIPLHLGVNIIGVPVQPPPPGRTGQRRRIPAGYDALRQPRAQPLATPQTEIPAEKRRDKAVIGNPAMPHLALGQRMQPHRFQPPRQRILHRRHCQHIGRPGKHEPPRRPAAIHLQLQRREKGRRPLHLVQRHPLRQVGDEAHRVSRRPAPHHIIVKADVGMGWASRPRQSGFPALARPLNQNHRRILKGLVQPSLNKARV